MVALFMNHKKYNQQNPVVRKNKNNQQNPNHVYDFGSFFQSGYRFGFGSVFSVFRFIKNIYHIKTIFNMVWFGLYTVGFWFIRFYTKKP